MKASIRKSIALVLAMIFVLCALSGCGSSSSSKVDYSTMKYSDFIEAEGKTENYWDSKEIAYQYVMREEGNASPYTGVYWGMLNLYTDGSAAIWEPSGLAGSYFDPVERYDPELFLLEVFYGYWEEADSTVTVNVFYEEDGDVSTFTADVSSMPSAMTVELAYSGGPIPGFDFDCDGTVQYATWEEYCHTHSEIVTELEG